MATTVELFPWQAKYSVGLPDIDKQHQKLIGYVNDLHAAMLHGEAKAVLARILDDLVNYVETHFAAEERLMRMRGYSEFAAHQLQHQNLTRQVLEMRERFRSGHLIITIEVMQFLKNWLSDHILVADMGYARELGALAHATKTP